ncbi:hypothetical protein SOX05_08880 [Pseudomonas putida]|nr:hypothetical protein [Pseudomonas putida]MDY4319376.1 hypothetical protein [Pseudomonas putida]MDY4352761.1 hypothetical protein [Pseudomonas putida]
MFESIMSDSLYVIESLVNDFGLKLKDLEGQEDKFEDLVKQAKAAGIKLFIEQKSTTGTYNHTAIDRAFKTELVRLIKNKAA